MMRSPLRAVREFREEFSRVMHEHERFLEAQLAPDADRLALARERRGSRNGETTQGVNDAHQ